METPVPQKHGSEGRLHNVRFYAIKPRGILSLAYNKLLHCLALSRDDGSIEIWNMHYAAYLQHVIPQTPDCQAEALVWAENRLFSVSLNGKLVEWDLASLQPRYEQLLTGNALWCVDVNSLNTELAVGSEEGYINIMSIEHNEITYKSLFNKQQDRVICCKFDKTGELLVTGSIGIVHIWDVSKKIVLHTMTLSAPDVIVWSLLVLSDRTIITGDSAGYATVWNGRNATQIEAYKMLNRNVFALAVNDSEDRLICSGMDPPLIRVLAKTTLKREESTYDCWIKFIQRDVHTHYIKALAMMGNCIISGGQDGILCFSSSKKTVSYAQKYVPFLRNPCVSLAPTKKHLLLRYPNALHLWRLGQEIPNNTDAVIGRCEEMLLNQMPEKLLQINVGGRHITAAAISPDSSWICYSTTMVIKIYRLVFNDKDVVLRAERIMNGLPPKFQPATRIIFMKDNEHMFLLNGYTRQLHCFRLGNDTVSFSYTIELSVKISQPITHLEISECSSYVIVASADQTIAVWHLSDGKQHEHLLNLPRYQAATTAMAMHQTQPLLAVAYTDGRIVEYNLAERCFTYEGQNRLIQDSTMYCIKGILYDVQHPILIVYTDHYIYVLEKPKDAADDAPPGGKTKRLNQSNDATPGGLTKNLRVKFMLNRKHIAQVCRLSDNELVTIGAQMNNLLALLPRPLQRKKFGAS